LASDLELPELAPQQANEEPDAEIALGRIDGPQSNGSSPRQVAGGSSFSIPEVANYVVMGGKTLIVEPVAKADPRNVRLYLLGSAMGLLLHQRGILPLHANAVEIEGQAVAFMGPSGAGKSTLAAWFHDRGFQVVADDVCAVHFDAQRHPWVSQGLPRLRLWKSALDATGRSDQQFERSYAGDDEWDKFDVPLSHWTCAGRLLPLAAVYLLSLGDELSIEALGGIAATDAIFANTYRGQYIDGVEQVRNHWESSLRLISSTPIFTATRQWGFDRFDEQVDAIIEHARGIARRTLKEVG
jgi:hypothetical protein